MTKHWYVLLSFFVFISLLFIFSALFSINILQSSSQFIMWTLYGWILFLALSLRFKFSHQRLVIFLFFLGCSLLFIGHSLTIQKIVQLPFLSFSPYQFILRNGGEHNHLGDLAGLVFTSFILFSPHFLITVPVLLFTIGIMAVSFSKSAFLGVFVVLLLLALQKRGRYLLGLVLFFIASFLVIAIYTKELSTIPLIKTSQAIMKSTFGLNPKPILSTRDSYYPQVFQAWNTAPIEQKLFGYGSGNYIYASKKTGKSVDVTPTETHNIFLNIFVENGIPTFFWFSVFCFIILHYGFKQKNPTLYLFIYLLVNFQSDYTYMIPFFLGLFFFFAGQTIHTKEQRETMGTTLFITALSFLIGLTILSELSIFINAYYKILSKNLLVASAKKNEQAVHTIVPQLELMTPYEESEIIKWSLAEESIGDTKEAIRLLDKLAVYSPRWYLYYLPHLIELKKRFGVNPKQYLDTKKEVMAHFPLTDEEKKQLNKICQEAADMICIK